MEISRQIEALLFFRGEPVTVGFLAKALVVSEDEVRGGLEVLERSLSGRGVILMRNSSTSADPRSDDSSGEARAMAGKDEYTLGTAPEMGATIETLLKEELNKDLGKAGLETLATVLYRGPISRSEINYLRGVNSNYILRALLVRGLIEKVDQGGRSTVYRPTFELLSYMGVAKVEDLPGYEETVKAVEEFHEANDKYDNKEE